MGIRDILITDRSARLPGDYQPQGTLQPNGIPDGAVPEFRFHPTRRWRFDWAWPEARVALEIEGGVWTRGRHTRAQGYIGDMEKYNAAALMGWHVLRVTPQQVSSGEAGRLVQCALEMALSDREV